ncbi:alpha/beta hydrolase [Pantoea cypripedii]|uniref:Serine aminopeptidase S33 domain-containing protein n=1 Tax=Pantoea cypripedii TaxID=55209 RepID=A0A1X1EY10_PANCY|nr:alpha/beta fold hydrolase [Pantoea cypripedii]ORM94920.1 hypothetical protein HA50_16840 [Pantoea cypripedii]
MSAAEVDFFQGVNQTMAVHRFLPARPRYLLLVIHGYGDTVGEYAAMAEAFTAHGAYVFGPDLPGHGLSPGDSRLITDLDRVVDNLHVLAEELHWFYSDLPLFVLGHSMGGLIATRYAQRYRHGLCGLILAAPLLGETTRITRLLRDEQPDEMHTLATAEAGRQWVGPFRKRTLEAIKDMLALTYAGPGFGSLPLLWLHGTEDNLVLAEETAVTLERLRGSGYRTVNIEGAGHNLFSGGAWYRTVSAIKTFIDNQLA